MEVVASLKTTRRRVMRKIIKGLLMSAPPDVARRISPRRSPRRPGCRFYRGGSEFTEFVGVGARRAAALLGARRLSHARRRYSSPTGSMRWGADGRPQLDGRPRTNSTSTNSGQWGLQDEKKNVVVIGATNAPKRPWTGAAAARPLTARSISKSRIWRAGKRSSNSI
jgi:hypothetical protein